MVTQSLPTLVLTLILSPWLTSGGTVHQTRGLEDCSDECRYHESWISVWSGNYFWCHTETGWDYCSPLPDTTCSRAPCRPGHPCGTHGESYTWCYTTNSNHWDYCGLARPGESVQVPLRRSKRGRTTRPPTTTTRAPTTTAVDTTGRRFNFYTTKPGKDYRHLNKKLDQEVADLINTWNNQGLGNQAGRLASNDNFRIDVQGMVNRENRLPYYNLQIQFNVDRSSGQSTTVSTVIAHPQTPPEVMRQAFTYSFQNGVNVEVEPAP